MKCNTQPPGVRAVIWPLGAEEPKKICGGGLWSRSEPKPLAEARSYARRQTLDVLTMEYDQGQTRPALPR